jgi:alkylation response protein AidB-like acyl-CoA dehydrogenase
MTKRQGPRPLAADQNRGARGGTGGHRAGGINRDAARGWFLRHREPKAFGGYEHDFDVLVDLTIELAKACASTAWVAGLLAAHQWLLASFPEEAQHDVWDRDPNAVLCGSYAPVAKAAAIPDGYRLSGRWSFASGCDNSSWSVCAALLPPSGERAAPAPAFLLVPADDYSIDDTWQVIGLAGTGSKTIVLDDVFVPAHRVLTFAETTSGRTPGARLYADNPTFAIPMLCNIPSCLAAVAVGAALGALEDYIDATRARRTAWPTSPRFSCASPTPRPQPMPRARCCCAICARSRKSRARGNR